MSLFAIVESGLVANVIVADAWPGGIDVTSVTPRPGPGWTHDGTNFTAPPPQAPVAEKRHITRLAFQNRLLQAERIKLDLAADRPVYRDDENAAETRAQFQSRRQNAAAFRDMQKQADLATFIDLDRPDTRAGIQQLETLGILGVGRALIVLDAPVQDHERYHG